MATATFRFYGALNDFLPARQRQTSFARPFVHRVSVKDVIESLGVPHPEVGLLLANGESVDFGYLLQDGDAFSVYPLFYTLEAGALSRVQPPPLPDIRFVLDTHLGKLATYLRMLGVDTLYRNDYADDELALISGLEKRILLTRDRALLMRNRVEYGYYVRHTQPRQQLEEVTERYGLAGLARPFSRCLACNGQLNPVARADVLAELPDHVRQTQEAFFRCDHCGRVYWPGTHYQRMQAFLASVLHPPRA